MLIFRFISAGTRAHIKELLHFVFHFTHMCSRQKKMIPFFFPHNVVQIMLLQKIHSKNLDGNMIFLPHINNALFKKCFLATYVTE